MDEKIKEFKDFLKEHGALDEFEKISSENPDHRFSEPQLFRDFEPRSWMFGLSLWWSNPGKNSIWHELDKEWIRRLTK